MNSKNSNFWFDEFLSPQPISTNARHRKSDIRVVVAAGGNYSVPVKLPVGNDKGSEGVVVLGWEFEVYGNNEIAFGIMGGKGEREGMIRERRICKGGR